MAYKTKLLNKAEEQKQNTTLFRLQNIFTWMWSPVDSFPKLHNYTSAIELLFILGFSCGKTASKSQCAYIQVCVYHALWAELVGNQSTILREINFGWFQRFIKCYLNCSEGSKFSFLGNYKFENVKISKNSKFTGDKMVKVKIGTLWSSKVTHFMWNQFWRLCILILKNRQNFTTTATKNVFT